MEDNSPMMRYDFRCNLCRIKNVFHCEHDTPYRDQFLGLQDENTSGPNSVNNQKTKTTQNNGVNQKQQQQQQPPPKGKSNAGDHTQNQQSKKRENKPSAKHEAHAENKPAKSCTIL